MKKLPSAAATLAIATPMALAGLPGPRVLTLGISREGHPDQPIQISQDKV